MKIDSVSKCKDDFYKAIKTRIFAGTNFEKRTAQVISFDFFFARDYFRGYIDKDYLWIFRPRIIRFPLAQRVFSGYYTEEDGHVVVQGSFRFANYEKWLVVAFSAVIAFISFLYLARLSALTVLLAFLISFLVGGCFWGCFFGISMLTSIRCEKDVIRLLSKIVY